MEKLIGYSELTVDGESIPLKCGMLALEAFLEIMGVDVDEIGTLFKRVPNPQKKGTTVEVPKNLIKFFAAAIWASANYASRKLKGKQRDILEVYEWLEELGLESPQVQDFYQEFYLSLLNGAKKTQIEEPKSKKKALEDK